MSFFHKIQQIYAASLCGKQGFRMHIGRENELFVFFYCVAWWCWGAVLMLLLSELNVCKSCSRIYCFEHAIQIVAFNLRIKYSHIHPSIHPFERNAERKWGWSVGEKGEKIEFPSSNFFLNRRCCCCLQRNRSFWNMLLCGWRLTAACCLYTYFFFISSIDF